MLDFFFKTMIVVFGAGFLMFLGAFIYDHSWFKFAAARQEKVDMAKKEAAKRVALREYYDRNPEQDPSKHSR